MGLWDLLFGANEENAHAIFAKMISSGGNARRGASLVHSEYHRDPDGRLYVLEYVSTPNARHAIVFCRKNPWGSTPNAGVEYHIGHVASNGFLCLGSDHKSQRLLDSPYPLEFVIKRARYWCTAFSYFKETGTFPQL